MIQNWEHPILFIEYVHHRAQPICYQNVGLRIGMRFVTEGGCKDKGWMWKENIPDSEKKNS